MPGQELKRAKEAIDHLGLAIHESLLAMVWEYKHRTGCGPKVILAEYDAFLYLMKDTYTMALPDGSHEWMGIPLKAFAGDGVSIYLCGDPIPIRGLEEYRGRSVPPKEV